MNRVDSVLDSWFGEAPERSDEEQNRLRNLYEPLREIERQRDALLAILRDATRYAEWHDKIIYPVEGEAHQNWCLTVYLPVPLSGKDKSPETALNRAIDTAIRSVEE